MPQGRFLGGAGGGPGQAPKPPKAPTPQQAALRGYSKSVGPPPGASGAQKFAQVQNKLAAAQRPQTLKYSPRGIRAKAMGTGVFSKPSVTLLSKTIAGLGDYALAMPAGMLLTGEAAAHDVKNSAEFGLGMRSTPGRSHLYHQIAVPMAKSVLQSVEHPERDPASTLLNFFALASGGATAASRLGLLGKLGAGEGTGALGALRAGQGVKAAVSRPGYEGGSLMRTPYPGESTLTMGGKTVDRIRPDSSLMQIAHNWRTGRLQADINNPAGSGFALIRAQKALTGKMFGGANAFGREARAARDVQTNARMAPAAQLAKQAKTLSGPERRALDIVRIEGTSALKNPAEAVARHAATHRQWAAQGFAPEANLAFAKKLEAALPVLKNPSERFTVIRQASKQLADAEQAQKIENGLLTHDQAMQRIANEAALYRGGEPLRYQNPAQVRATREALKQGEQLNLLGGPANVERVAPEGAWYTPQGARFREGLRPPPTGAMQGKPGEFGLAPPDAARAMAGSQGRFTGLGRQRAMLTENPAKATAQASQMMQRFYGRQDLHGDALKAASAKRTSLKEIAIRVDKITPELRAHVEEQLRVAAETGNHNIVARVLQQLHDTGRDIASEHTTPVGESVRGVKWLDPRALKQSMRGPQGQTGNFVKHINMPFRLLGVEGKVAYFPTNYVQNLLMQSVIQGPRRAAMNWHAAIDMPKYLKPQVDASMGTTRMQSMLPGGKISGAESKLIGGATRVIDTHGRRMAFLHNVQRAGIGRRDWPAQEALIKAAAKGERRPIAVLRRAQKDAVQFNMTPAEQGLSNAMYFYPWTTRASVWGGRALLNHPIKAAMYAQQAKLGMAYEKKLLGDVPAYMKGWIKTKAGVVNPWPFSPFSTPAQFGETVNSVMRGKGGAQSFAEALGTPFAAALGTTGPNIIPRLMQQTAEGAMLRRLGVQGPNVLGKPLFGKPSKSFPATGILPAAEHFGLGIMQGQPNLSEIHKAAYKEMPPVPRFNAQVSDLRSTLMNEYEKRGLITDKTAFSSTLDSALAEHSKRYLAYKQAGAKGEKARFAVDVKLIAGPANMTPEQVSHALAWSNLKIDPSTGLPPNIQRERALIARAYFPQEATLAKIVKGLTMRGVKVTVPR